jgi:uncharacterized membrane protein YfhO
VGGVRHPQHTRTGILDIMGRRLIGLYDVILFRDLPGLWIMIIWANFHSIVKKVSLSILLKIVFFLVFLSIFAQ